MSERPVATLHPTSPIERWSPSKKAYVWVEACIVETPDGNMLAPPFPVKPSHFDESARSFCESQGWAVKIAKQKTAAA